MKNIPQIGYGTWNRPESAAYDGVVAALEAGYRHLDCAEGYDNEEFVGSAIADVGLPRDQLWVTTKVAPESFGPGQVRPHVEASLDKLGVGPVDLLLLHYPSIGDEYDIEDYMAQFAEVYDAGLCHAIGVSNFTKPYIARAVELLGDRKLLVNQVELHVYLHNRPIVDDCTARGIRMTAYSPLARGKVLEDPVLREIGGQVGGTASQVALAWLLAKGYVVIPSAGAPARIAENFAAQDLDLSPDQLARIDSLNAELRLVDGPWCPAWDVA
ncbi:aldo/keto reductase [Pseudooctadecabacter jejudonensis]|uniref:2,5-diketo-D-gluconic acid reductase B n=1 Tax=Pseudooctadecabacter jejudonensis TaxID=1391910 RepID=A0A1Y5SZN2_9RHOB|nr:aldo/keto reductase [Pseudooctadecabacter jejudonensis]SLN50592.1 2,5-diketo-D-gluconic acid reductase B [Pseudooctadecabacter jejudonensis]